MTCHDAIPMTCVNHRQLLPCFFIGLHINHNLKIKEIHLHTEHTLNSELKQPCLNATHSSTCHACTLLDSTSMNYSVSFEFTVWHSKEQSKDSQIPLLQRLLACSGHPATPSPQPRAGGPLHQGQAAASLLGFAFLLMQDLWKVHAGIHLLQKSIRKYRFFRAHITGIEILYIFIFFIHRKNYHSLTTTPPLCRGMIRVKF